MKRQVAALFVDPKGSYYNLPNVDAWDISKDARLYGGPYPVVAHPPCARWCRLAVVVEARWGYKRGQDEGCFASALASVRAFGGVLEHPAYTAAWPAYGLPRPPLSGWRRTFCGGWVCHVEQVNYGHPARKATWLYAYGTDALPDLRWGPGPPAQAVVGGNYRKCDDNRPKLNSSQASSTPVVFRDILIDIALSVYK